MSTYPFYLQLSFIGLIYAILSHFIMQIGVIEQGQFDTYVTSSGAHRKMLFLFQYYLNLLPQVLAATLSVNPCWSVQRLPLLSLRSARRFICGVDELFPPNSTQTFLDPLTRLWRTTRHIISQLIVDVKQEKGLLTGFKNILSPIYQRKFNQPENTILQYYNNAL